MDGTCLRAARADDGPKIRRAFKNINQNTIYIPLTPEPENPWVR
jgi:hypothetical protein